MWKKLLDGTHSSPFFKGIMMEVVEGRRLSTGSGARAGSQRLSANFGRFETRP
jgi:hypothetical protein